MNTKVPCGVHELQSKHVVVGHACISEFETMWFRAVIEKIEGDNVTIRYVDYGQRKLFVLEHKQSSYLIYFCQRQPMPVNCCKACCS